MAIDDELFGEQIDAAIERFQDRQPSEEAQPPDEALQAEAMEVSEEAGAESDAEPEPENITEPDQELQAEALAVSEEQEWAEPDEQPLADATVEELPDNVTVTDDEQQAEPESDDISELRQHFDRFWGEQQDGLMENIREMIDERVDASMRRRVQ